jgi:hypothetical protein
MQLAFWKRKAKTEELPMSYAFRVYLDLGHGWEEFGTDYISRTRADQAATAFRLAFPNNRYFVRRVMIRDDNGRTR